jgi:hypothetical protein
MLSSEKLLPTVSIFKTPSVFQSVFSEDEEFDEEFDEESFFSSDEEATPWDDDKADSSEVPPQAESRPNAKSAASNITVFFIFSSYIFSIG